MYQNITRGKMNFIKLLTYLFFVLNIISCASNSQVILPEYQNVDIQNKELLIVQVDSITDNLSVFDSSDSLENYISLFYREFENTISSEATFSKVLTSHIENKEILNMQRLEISHDVSEVLLPSSDKLVIAKNGFISDFVLFMIKLELYSGLYEDPNVVRDEPRKAVVQEIHYALWDNQRGQLVSYGKTNASGGSYLLNQASFRIWTVRNAKNIIENSPFNNKSTKKVL